jgi:hypothetical protein
MSSYKGLFVHHLFDGSIDFVQVEDLNGNSLPLPPDEYVNRGIYPLINSLPNCDDLSNAPTTPARKE